MKFTEIEIEILVDLLREGSPLPRVYKDRIVFEDDYGEADEEPDSQQPLSSENLMGLIGSDLKKTGLFDQIRKIAHSDIPVLIEGEKGTGKRLAARTIHEMGPRAGGPFIIVDCGSLSEALAETQLSGHDRGAFTGAVAEKEGLIEMAQKGTIVFQDVDALTLRTQTLMLRFLETKSIVRLGSNHPKSIDARVIVTSHRDLKAAVKEGCFRDDLYFHISSITLSIPPLRARLEDIPALAKLFLQEYAKQNNKRTMVFSSEAMRALWQHNWPGNVIELENRIKRAVVLAMGRKVIPTDLGFDIPKHQNKYAGMSLRDAREKMEKDMILHTLSRHHNNITRTAEDLGISRPTLYELMEKLDIPKPK
jgi:two-component system NtrC family response regulator